MHSQRRSAIAMLAALAALVLAATAWADTGSDAASSGTATAPRNGGTAAGPAPAVEDSGGVSGPAGEPAARQSQQPAQDEQPPQVEDPPPDEPAPDGEEETETVPDEAPAAPDDDSAAAPGTSAGTGGGGGSGSGGLPSTGLEIGALVAMGLGLLLAGVALRRRPTT